MCLCSLGGCGRDHHMSVAPEQSHLLSLYLQEKTELPSTRLVFRYTLLRCVMLLY